MNSYVMSLESNPAVSSAISTKGPGQAIVRSVGEKGLAEPFERGLPIDVLMMIEEKFSRLAFAYSLPGATFQVKQCAIPAAALAKSVWDRIFGRHRLSSHDTRCLGRFRWFRTAGRPLILAPFVLLSPYLFAATHSIDLSWDASPTPGVTYTVKRAATLAGPYTFLVGSLPVLAFIDGGLAPNASFCYQVVAVNAGVESLPSNSSCATTLPDPKPQPAAASNLQTKAH